MSLVLERVVPATEALADLVDLATSHTELSVSDCAALAAARAGHLPLVTGVAELAGIDPDVAVVILRRRAS